MVARENHSDVSYRDLRRFACPLLAAVREIAFLTLSDASEAGNLCAIR
jgi:hypothetical protein